MATFGYQAPKAIGDLMGQRGLARSSPFIDDVPTRATRAASSWG